RMFLSAGSQVMAVRTRDFERDVDVDLDEPVRALTTSPSGDRMFALVQGSNDVLVVDRFEGKVVSRIRIAGPTSELRMDPLGRVLLVRGEDASAWVVDIGTASVVGLVRTEWRGDL